MYRVGIDMGGTRIKIGLIKDGMVVTSKVIEAAPNKGLRAHLPLLTSEIVCLCKKMQHAPIEAIGLAFPGLVNTNTCRVIDTSSKYVDAPSIDLTRWAKETFNVPFRMDNDARLACLGEWCYGAGKGVLNMVMFTLGTGIGSAVVMDGKLIRGKHFQAGILGGHIVIDYKDKTHLCSCGKYGCVEGVASMWMIEKMAIQHSMYNKSQLAQVDKINWETIIDLCETGDELSILLKQHCLNVWAIGLVNLIHAYDPDRIVIGGGIMHSADIILPYFKKVIEERAWCPGGFPELREAKFPDTAALLGAAALFDKEL